MEVEMTKTERGSPSKAPPTSPDLRRRPITGFSLSRSLKTTPTHKSLGQPQRDLYRERQRYSGPALSFNYVFICFFVFILFCFIFVVELYSRFFAHFFFEESCDLIDRRQSLLASIETARKKKKEREKNLKKDKVGILLLKMV